MAKPVIIYEFELDELLNDPMVILVMQSDGLCPEATRSEIYALRKRLRPRPQTSRAHDFS